MNFLIFLIITSPWISHRLYSLEPKAAGLILDPVTDLYWNPVDTLPRWIALGGWEDSIFISYGSKWVSLYMQGGLEVEEEGGEETLRLENEKIFFAVRTHHLKVPLGLSFLHTYKRKPGPPGFSHTASVDNYISIGSRTGRVYYVIEYGRGWDRFEGTGEALDFDREQFSLWAKYSDGYLFSLLQFKRSIAEEKKNSFSFSFAYRLSNSTYSLYPGIFINYSRLDTGNVWETQGEFFWAIESFIISNVTLCYGMSYPFEIRRDSSSSSLTFPSAPAFTMGFGYRSRRLDINVYIPGSLYRISNLRGQIRFKI
jgi:hypothetical protein